MNVICTYQEKCQASQFKREFDVKFHDNVEVKSENGCYSIYTHAEITPEILSFVDEFLLSRENRTYPDLKFWKDKEALLAIKTG